VIRRIARRSYAAAGAATIVAATAGCGALLGAPVASQGPTAPLRLTAAATPSMLVVVTGPGGPGRLVSQVVSATARPREDLDLLAAGLRARPVIASTSPAPAAVPVPGRPAAPGHGASTYQEGQYQHALTRWREQVTAGKHAVATRTKAAVARWVHSLRLPVAATRPAGQRSASLPRDCSVAASTVSGLVDQAGSRFGGRVVLLSVASLGGMPAPGELDGDDVIVVTPYVPGAAVASAAQLDLLDAGASFAAVLGPEATPAQLDHLVSESLSGRVVSEVLSGQALFTNNSAALRPAAARILAPVVTDLRRPDASGVVNGFASAPGGAHHNQVLSEDRASAVAGYLEARGVPRSSLTVVGHGASNLVAPGTSGDNRRVVVVIEEPVSAGT
jgi:outer membrane protein OmpA-like peptidoglycan-associated protein